MSLLSWAVAPLAVGLGILHAFDDSSPPSIFFTVSIFLFFFGVLVGSLSHHPHALVWMGATATGAAIVLSEQALPTLWTPTQIFGREILYTASQLILALMLAFVLRSRIGSRSRQLAADGLIVSIGAWIISWVLLVQPSIAMSTSSELTIARGLTIACAMLVVFLLAILVFSDTSPTPATGMLGIAVGLILTNVILRALATSGEVFIQSQTIEAPFIMALGLSGAAFLHSSSSFITAPHAQRPTPPLMARLISTTAALIVPIIVVAVTDPNGMQDRIVRTISVAVLTIAAMSRIVQSVRANARTQDKLIRNALTDSLTGLPNRVLMLQHIEQAVQSQLNSIYQPTVLFIDVDRFKNINDSLGHSTGDNILQCVAERLRAAIPTNASVGRIAGDEFVVLDPTTQSPTQSVMLAEKILDAFRDPIATSDGDMFVTASIGVAYASKDVELSADNLMQHADTAMYRAKDSGRNCIALFDDSMLEKVTKRLEIETALYRALERNELRMVHQPIVDIDLGIVVGFEALMRWDRGDAGVVSPIDFIPIAEETGTIVPLGSWAINDALLQLRLWIDAEVVAPSTTMSVNVSPRQLHDPQFVSIVSEALTRSGVAPEQLWLEVTETIMITEPAQALSALKKLNALGVRIAIDDFGTGYSSLSVLQQFPVQCIKIDRAFVQDLATSEGSRSMVRTIIALAKSMNADIVAEGIEELAQLQILNSLQCHKAQGYFISRPIPVEEVPTTVLHIQNFEFWRQRTSG